MSNFKINIYVTLLFIIFLNYNFISAQSINNSRQSSYYTYVYKLSEKEADKIYEKDKISLDIIENKLPIDSFPTDSTIYPEYETGSYLFALIRHKYIELSIETYSNLKVRLIENQRDLSIEVRNQNYEFVKDATVTLDNKQIKYNSEYNSYLLPNTKKKGTLKIKKNDEVEYYDINNHSYKRRRHFTIIYYAFFPIRLLYNIILYPGSTYRLIFKPRRYSRSYSHGYIATNKPQYLPSDTVKIKAYILNKKDKPVKKDLTLTVTDSKRDKVFSTNIESTKNGAYIYEFKLGDSLKIDQEYKILLKNKKGNRLAENHFYLEDYQLKDAIYSFWLEKESYYYKDSIRFYAMASDINELPLYDARVKISANVISVSNFQNQNTNIPMLLWEKEIDLNPDDLTQITIPDSIIPNATMKIKLTATFNNSNNETKIYSTIFDILNVKDELIINEIDNNYILESDSLVDNLITVESEYYDGFKDTSNLTIPSKLVLNPLISNYTFKINNKEKTILSDDIPNMINVDLFRLKDTIYVKIKNPRNIDVKYVVYKKDKEIIRGETHDEFIWKNYDKTATSYYVNYNFTWAGRSFHRSVNLYQYENELKINIEQPEIVFPGQKSETKIKVLDYQNKPVSNADITAFSTNAKLDRSNIPTLYYLGKTKKRLKTLNNYRCDKSTVTTYVSLNKKWLNKTQSDTLLFYKFHYPIDNVFLHYDTNYVEYSQFAPFVFNKGSQQPIYYIYADSTLIYFNETFEGRPFSFPLEEGFHSLRIRTKKYEYFLDSIYIKPNQKLNLSFIEKNGLLTHKKRNSHFLTKREVKRLGKNIFVIHKLSSKFNFWQGINRQIIDVSYRKNIKIGPFDLSQPVEYSDSDGYNSFTFKPNTFYKFIYTDNSFEEVRKFRPSQLKLKYRLVQDFDDVFRKESISKVKTPENKQVKETYLSSSYDENGTYIFNFNCDSLIKEYNIYKYNSLFLLPQVRGNIRIIYNLLPGLYKIEFTTIDGNILLKDSIQIYPRTYTCENINGENLTMLNDKKDKKHILNYYPNTVSGKIINDLNDAPVPFAFISVKDYYKKVNIETFSNEKGEFLIENIPIGGYDIEIKANGFKEKSEHFYVSESKNNIDYQLREEYSQYSFLNSSSFQKPELKHPYQSYRRRGLHRMRFGRKAHRYKLRKARGFSSGRSVSSPSFDSNDNFINSNVSATYEDNQIFKKPDIDHIPLIECDTTKLNIRSNFVDYAYWQPILSTNSEGEAAFTFKYPDNITKWLNYALVLNNKKQSGIGFSVTKSLSRIAANLSTPRFLMESDSTNIIGKVFNYSDETLRIKTGLNINDSLAYSNDTSIQHICVESFPVNCTHGDSLSFSYYLQLENGFSDGEKKTIPIYPVGIYENTGKFYILDNDTTIEAKFNLDSGNVKIIANNSEKEVLLNDARWLYNYKYFCNEQKASKLIGLLSEKFISETLNKNFKKEHEIRKLIREIEKDQLPSGAFGWWKGMEPSIWVTNYVLNALYYAQQNGYKTPALEKGINFLKEWLDVISIKETRYSILNTLYLLSEIGEDIDYNFYLNKVNTNDLNQLEKFKIIGIKQNVGLEYNINEILKSKKETMLGGIYWEEHTSDYSIFYNSTQLTLLAYKILDKEKQYRDVLKSIAHYFFEKKMNQSWRNTIETAKILETILPTYIKNSDSKLITSRLQVNEINIPKLPYETTLDTNFVKISKTGTTPVFLTLMQEQWNSNPNKNEKNFKINTYFEQNGNIITDLKSGEPVKLIAEITPLKDADFVMIEVPIPAGCSYDKKAVQRFGVYTEYFKNRANFYCESMKTKTYKFEIELQPRYTGKYTLNPAKVELMYFPTFYSNEVVKRVYIK